MDLVELAKQNTNLRHPWETTRINIVAEKIESLLVKLGKKSEKATILDVGSGDAYVIDQLAARFKNVNFVAVDTYYSADIITTLQKGFTNGDKIKLYNDWELFATQNHHVDIILLLDVIEHVPDDIAFLKEIGGYVKSPFHFIITVPAFQSLFTKHDAFLKHYRRYDNTLLKKNVSEAGWSHMQVGYFYIIALVTRSLGKLKEMTLGANVSDKGISEWKKSKGFTGFVNSILWMDYKFSSILRKIGVKLPGLSNYCIGKREVK